MSGPSLVRVELGLGPAVDKKRARELVEGWLQGGGIDLKVLAGRSAVRLFMVPRVVERTFAVQLAWRASGRRRRWEIVRRFDPVSGSWTDTDAAVLQTRLSLPMPALEPPAQGMIVSASLSELMQPGEPVPPRIAPGGVDPGIVRWHPPVYLPTTGDVHPGELGSLMCGGSRRLKAWTPLPASDALLRAEAASRLAKWPGAHVLPRHGSTVTASSVNPVVLDVVEPGFDANWVGSAATRGHRTKVVSEGASRDKQRRDAFDPIDPVNGARFRALEVALDKAGGLMFPSFDTKVQAPVAGLCATYDDKKRKNLYNILRGALDQAIEGRGLAEGLVHRRSQSGQGGRVVPMPTGWTTADGHFQTPDWWAEWVTELSKLCSKLAKAPSGGRYEDAPGAALMASTTRLYQALRLRDVADGLIALSRFFRALRKEVEKIGGSERDDADHGAMVATCAMSVVGDRVDVRLVYHSGFNLDGTAPSVDRKVVRSLSWGKLLDPLDTRAWKRAAADLAEDLAGWREDQTLFVLAVANQGTEPGLDAWAVLAGKPNVIIVGGCYTSPGTAHGPSLQMHASPYQHGYRVKVGSMDMRVPDVCAPTEANALGNSALYLGVDDAWRFGSGSSQATPLFAAACALLWSANPGWTAPQLKSWVLEHGCTRFTSGSFHAPAGVAGLSETDAASNEGARTLDLKKALAALQTQRAVNSPLLQGRGGKR